MGRRRSLKTKVISILIIDSGIHICKLLLFTHILPCIWFISHLQLPVLPADESNCISLRRVLLVITITPAVFCVDLTLNSHDGEVVDTARRFILFCRAKTKVYKIRFWINPCPFSVVSVHRTKPSASGLHVLTQRVVLNTMFHAPMERFQLELIYFYYPFFHRRPTQHPKKPV